MNDLKFAFRQLLNNPSFTAVAVLVFAQALPALADSGRQVDIHVQMLDAPSCVTANGKPHLSYDLHITNFRDSGIELKRLEVFAGVSTNQLLAAFEGPDLSMHVKALGPVPKGTSRSLIAPGFRSVIFVDVTAPVGAPPAGVNHRLTFESVGVMQSNAPFVLHLPSAAVSKETPVVIDAPFRGGGWTAVNGLGTPSHHRVSILAVNGEMHVPQRYAIDWIKIGENGRAVHGDTGANTNWYGYGEEIIAVADGVITDTKDGMPDNAPLTPKPKLSFEDSPGNGVILKLGKKRFAVYGHFQPRSIRVRVGQRVKKGDVLGLLGNSGASDAPHLHLHVMEVNTALFGKEVPYVFKSFFIQRVAKSFEEIIVTGLSAPLTDKSDKRTRELPMNFTVARFP